jgi:protein-disulfide isomerase
MSELTLPVDDKDHSKGPKDAPVTLVEYGDFECPYCGQMYGVIKEVQKIMGDRIG